MTESTRPPISGVVICFNEEGMIGRCLESLSFCDEIVVVDSGSTDRTVEVCGRHADQLIEQEFLGYVKQKNFALEHATHDWVVCLDADEELSDEAVRGIQDAVASNGEGAAGYRLDRITYFLGVWHDLGEWSGDWQLRVFQRSKGRWTGRDPHDRVEVDGQVRTLPGQIRHYNYRDLSDHLVTINQFSTRLAREMRDEGIRFRLVDLLLRPLGRFCKGYLLRRGFQKGLPGFLVSISTAYYVFMKYAKLWELERSARR